MCGRFFLATPPETLQQLFEFALPEPSWDPERTDRPRFNVAPTQPVLVVEGGPQGVRKGSWARWGIFAAHKRLAINAKSETVFARPAFRAAIRRRRGVVLADGFFEWRTEGKSRLPYLFERRDGRPMALGAVLADVQVEGVRRLSCAILTTQANADVQALHDRMPVILDGAALDRWLEPGLEERSELESFFIPLPANALSMRSVSMRLNKVENDDSKCLDPAETTAPKQLGFGF